MSTSWEMDGKPKKPDLTAIVVDSAIKIYGCHSSNGRVYISMAHALKLAAALVGAARSESINDLIKHASADPDAALDVLRRAQETFVEEVDADRQAQINRLAEAMRN